MRQYHCNKLIESNRMFHFGIAHNMSGVWLRVIAISVVQMTFVLLNVILARFIELSHSDEQCYDQCHSANVILLNFIFLNVILLNVILLNVILLNVILLNVILLNVIILNVILVNVKLLNVILLKNKHNFNFYSAVCNFRTFGQMSL
jgi:hypothetical protein